MRHSVLIYFFIFFVGVSLIGGSVFTTYSQFVGEGPLPERTEVVVPRGSLKKIANVLYEKGIKAGALGGKLLGAGGGGFLVFYVTPDKQDKVKKAMKDLLYIPFKFDNAGTSVVHYTPEVYELKERNKK